MGELLDKFERASKGTVQPLGFGGFAKREKVAPMLLMGAVEAGDDAQAKLAAEAGLDAIIVSGRNGGKQADLEKSVKAIKNATVGVWQDEATATEVAGADFQVFTSEQTPIGALGGEKRTNVMQVAPDIEDSLLRTIEYLPVDAFVVSLKDADKLTVSQLMRLARVRGVTSRWLLAYLPMLPTKDEAEQLRETGVSGIVVDVAGRKADELRACRDAFLELPHDMPQRNRRRGVATLPSPGPRESAPSRREPEPEPDDPDEDD